MNDAIKEGMISQWVFFLQWTIIIKIVACNDIIGILQYDKGPDHLLSLSIYNEKYWAIILVSYDLQLNFLNKKKTL